jgi:hypothetical protein
MRSGRPSVDKKVQKLIKKMIKENPLWGAPILHGELIKLGIEISERTVSNMIKRYKIILDESIYPRKGIDHRRVGIFAENIRDGFTFDPIEVAPCSDKPDIYSLLDGAHRWAETSRYFA